MLTNFFENFYKNFIYFNLSMDYKFFSNIFLLLESQQQFLNFFSFTLTESVNYLVLRLHFILNLLLIIYIIFSLLLNMFSFSIRFYFINRLLNIQWSFLNYKHWFWLRDRIIGLLASNLGFLKKSILVYYAADNLLATLVLLYTIIIFNLSIYYNFFNINFLWNTFDLSLNFTFHRWISYGLDSINFGFIMDNLSLLMLVVVLTISTLVHYYSIDYMSSDPRLLTFLKYLSGFTLAMVILVTADNLALLFLGWEGVGIFSYLLIGFWYTRTLALKASLKAVIVNRIGDAALIIATTLTLQYFGTIEFKKLYNIILYVFDFKLANFTINFYFFDFSIISLICFFFLIAAIGKSAQFGLHTWLPDAMEGPTPVSALIHAATMVTAGVYLIVWMSFFFELTDLIWNLVLIIGSLTALFGSITACFQYDIKRIIAFSTCSQLGYMFLACGLSAYNLAMFHLFIHAFFKALLFLCAGSVIHAIGDEQDIWKMGGLLNYLPITYVGLCVGFFSLAGLPFTSGFFSKDTIIELALTKRSIPGAYAYISASLGAFFTAFYSFWFFYHVIFKTTKLSRSILSQTSEHGKNMLSVIFFLTIITIIIGGLTKNPLTSPFSFLFFNDSIFVKNYNFYFNTYEIVILFYEYLHNYYYNYLKLILFITPIVGILISHQVYWYISLYVTYDKIYDYSDDDEGIIGDPYLTIWGLNVKEKQLQDYFFNFLSLRNFQKFFENKGYTDLIYNSFVVKPLLYFSYEISFKQLDRGWLEFFLVKIPSYITFFFAKILNQSFGTLKLNFLPAIFFLFTFLTYVVYLVFN